MAKIEQVLVPDIGDFDAVEIVEVLVSAGDEVAVDDSLIVLESDKATMDVPSTTAGKVLEVKVKVGDQVGEGAVILTLEAAEEEAATEAPAAEAEQEEAAAETAPPPEPSPPSATPAEPPAAEAPEPTPEPVSHHDHKKFTKAYASPAVRRYARKLGVDLTRIQGTGRKNRILKEDVQAFVKKALAGPAAAAGPGGALPPMPVIDFSKFGEIEKKPLTRIQKLAGPNLHRSWLHVPHVTQHDEADVTELEAFRQQHKGEAKAQGFNLTPLVFIMKAAVATLKEYPTVNASLDPDGQHLILKRYYNIGVAVDTEDGLVVPVVRNVDQKSLFDLARELAETSVQARERKLKPDQVQGASFTISSLGGIGGTFFTPIVNAPEVAILGVSRSYQKPVWQDGAFVPRLTLPLSLSYDHRVIDGALAVRFTTYLSRILSDIRQLLL